MLDIKNTLMLLTSAAGVSGDEAEASRAAADILKNYAEDVYIDGLYNVRGFVRSGNENAPVLMLDAHIDRVGLVVTDIDENGFISVGACGSPDVKTLLAQNVTIYGREKIKGVVSTLPPHVSKDKNVPKIKDIYIDAGFSSKADAEEFISLGDRITINSRFRELSENVVSAAAIDDRGGVAAVLLALDMLSDKKRAYDIAVSFSVGEEVGKRGAKMTAFGIEPDKALVVDVSFGETPDSSKKDTAPVGSGAMVGFSAVLDREMSNELCALAKENEIPHTREIMPESTGTNADDIAVCRRGVKCCTLSFPIKYMHTAVETVDIRDIKACAELICKYAEVRDDK